MALIIQQPITPKQQLYLYFIIGIALLAFWPLYLAYLSPITFPLDDAYIVLHNAQVLHWGCDPNYVGVPALIGSTSIVHATLVSLLMFWLTPTAASLVIQWFSIALYATGLVRLACLFKVTLWQALLFLVTSLLIGFMPYHLLSGLETTLAMAAVVWSLIYANQPVTKSQRILLALLCGVLPFIRPELALWSILLLLYQAKRYHHAVFNKFSQDCLLTLCSAAPWLIFFWWNTGLLYPNTLAAKVAFVAISTLPSAYKLHLAIPRLGAFILDTSFLGVIGGLCLLLMTTLGRLAFLFICSVLSFYIFYLALGLDWNYGRYLSVLLPLILYGLLIGLKQQDKLLRAGANFLLIITFIQAIWMLPQHWKIYSDSRQYTLVELAGVAKWLQQNIPSNAVLIIHDAGYVAFATRLHLIDMIGLKTPSSIKYHQMLTLPSQGMKRVQALAMIMRNSHVQFLVIGPDWDSTLRLKDGLINLGWHFQLLRPSKNGFMVYQILPPENKNN